MYLSRRSQALEFGSKVADRLADPYRDLDVIDARAPRFNQAVIGSLALVAFLTGWWPLLGLLALQFALGLTLGRRFCLPCLAYFELVQPRLGEGELEDARAALGFLRARHPAARAWVAGFSFGAWVAARLAASEPGVERMILVAPPVGTSSFEALRGSPVPKHVFQGSADTVCPLASLEREFPTWAEPRELIRVPGATHFFDRQLGALAEALSHALAGLVGAATS